ncbi:MAG: glycosyltransferase family 4 protein, partial [Chloroflexales bacterium]
RADVALVNGYLFEAHPELGEPGPPLIIDLYDPTLLENLELLRAAEPAERADRNRHDIDLLNRQVTAGDFFLCATERQRDLYIGALMAAGRITPGRVDADPLLRGLIDVVPFGLPAEPPARSGPGLRGVIDGIGPDDPIILWSGGLWDWMDPQTLIRAMPAIVARIPNARLVFLAGRHPGPAGAMRTPDEARALAAALGLLGSHAFFYDSWVPYARRADFLLDAAVVVSLHRQHLETAYAALRSRVLDHLWAGLPSLVSDGDQAAAMVREHAVGMVAPPQDAPAVADALIALLADSDLRAGMSARARALGPRLAWPGLVRPIIKFLAAAPAAPERDRTTATMDKPQPEAPPAVEDAAQVQRGRLLHVTRNAAIQALEHTWSLERLTAPPAGGRLASLRRLLQERLIWPLLHPLIARQQEQNAAVLRALYAISEQGDDQRAAVSHSHRRIDDALKGMADMNQRAVREHHLLAQQIRDFAEQLAGLEDADQQILARLLGELLGEVAD